jgi:hypothetical protein
MMTPMAPSGSGEGYWLLFDVSWSCYDAYSNYSNGEIVSHAGGCNYTYYCRWTSTGGGSTTGSPGGGSGSTGDPGPTTTPVDSATDAFDSALPPEIPDCGAANLPANAKLWCAVSPASMTATRLARVQSAIAAIRAKGSQCTALADVLDALLANGGFRVTSSGPNAFAPQNGNVNGYIGVNNKWTDGYYDDSHAFASDKGPLTLQTILAHEADHLLDIRNPADTNANTSQHVDVTGTTTTVNMLACGRT